MAQTTLDAQQKLDEMAVENVVLKGMKPPGYIKKQDIEALADGHIADLMPNNVFDESPVYQPLATPATDALLDSVRAEGVIMFASKQLAAAGDLESTLRLERLMLDAEEFAGQLRGSQEAK